jgi:hypothetical protein
MKTHLHLREILTLLLAIFLIGSLSAQKNIMFITNAPDFPGADGEDPNDTKYIEKLREFGYEVNVITTALTGADPIPYDVNNAVDACDAIVVSSTISSGAVAYCWPVRYNSKPFLTWESALWDELQISADEQRGTYEFAVDSFLTIEPGADTSIVGEYTGDIQVVSFAKGKPVFSGCLEEGIAAGAHLVARALGGWGEDVNDQKHVVLYYINQGEECIATADDPNTTSPRRSVAYWFEDATATHVTDIGWELFSRTMAFLVGESETPEAVISPSGIEGVSVSSFYSGSLYLDLTGINSITEIKIFDISGSLVLRKQVQGGDRVSVPMMQYADGVYIVMGEDFAEKFIKR